MTPGERRTAEVFGRLLELSDAQVLKVLAVIAAVVSVPAVTVYSVTLAPMVTVFSTSSAAATVAALERPCFAVHVPSAAGRMHALSQLLPRRVREGLMRALRTDRVLTEIDHDARRAYEARVR